MTLRIALAASLSLCSSALADETPAIAVDWSCRNVAVEIACNEDGCEASDDHTPMDVSVSRAAISVCAYSGCWEGRPSAWMQAGQFQIVTASALPFSTNPASVADVSVTVDTGSGVGTILISGVFAHPARCIAR